MTDLGEYTSLSARIDGRVVRVTFDNPPINLLDLPMILDLAKLGPTMAGLDDVNVVVFDSADMDFFIAHADVNLILGLPAEAAARREELGGIHVIFEQFRTLPMITIACIDGITRGGGSEFVLSLDMRFGSLGRAVLSQPEVALGIIPGGSGTQRLPRLMGRSRALEVACGGQDFPADVAERYGYLNRALPAGELRGFVDDLAARIASFPPESVRLVKQSVLAAEHGVTEGLIEEAHLFSLSLALPEARRRMAGFLQHGGQTREVEAHLDAVRSITDQFD